MARFLRAAQLEGRMIYLLYLMAINTGLRAGELAGLQWADVNFDARLITVQRSFDQPTKSDDVRYVPLLDSLLPELRRWRLEHPGHLVFTNQNGGVAELAANWELASGLNPRRWSDCRRARETGGPVLRARLFRMGQFFEAYRGEGKVSPLVTQLPWTHHVIILSQTRHPEERELYLFVAIKERVELVDSAGLRGRE